MAYLHHVVDGLLQREQVVDRALEEQGGDRDVVHHVGRAGAFQELTLARGQDAEQGAGDDAAVDRGVDPGEGPGGDDWPIHDSRSGPAWTSPLGSTTGASSNGSAVPHHPQHILRIALPGANQS
jgi:hypothetical protein